MQRIKFYWRFYVATVGFVLVAVILNWRIYQIVDGSSINNLELFARNVVAGLNPIRVNEMTGQISDKSLDNYSFLRNQLIRTMEIGQAKKVKWVYLMRVRDDKVFFTVDSIGEQDFGHSEPGDEYTDYPKEILQANNLKSVQVARSYGDDWGHFLSIFVPVLDWNTAETVGVLGIDIDRSDYVMIIARSMLWPLLASIAIVFLLLTVLRQLRDQRLLRENVALFKTLTEGVLDAIAITDDQGRIILWNKAAEILFHRLAKEVLGQRLLELILPKNASNANVDEADKMVNFFETSNDFHLNETMEIEAVSKEGKTFNAEVTLAAIKLNRERHVVCLIRDVSDKKKKNDELLGKNKEIESQRKAIINVLEDVSQEKEKVIKQAEDLKKFKAAVDHSNEMMIFSDIDGKVLWGNPAVEKMTGFSLDEVIKAKVGTLWGRLMGEQWYANLWHTVKDKKKVFVGTIDNHRKNGEKFVSTLTIYPLLNEAGEIDVFVATQRDITREKEVDRMKTDFISLASHQLRTPLSGMKWFLEMLLAGDMGKLSKEQKEAVSNVDKSNQRMIALVGALLNISRIESGRIIIEPEPTDVVALAHDIVEELEQKFEEKKQNLILSADKKLPKINLDPRLIRQVLMNLLTNASKYTAEKGEIIVFISRKNQELVIQVSDNGYGIPEAEQSKMFERFFRATNVVKQETDGTGLGLYLVKAVVESSGGKIWFKSKEGIGTSFWFTLPLKGVKAKKGDVWLENIK